MAERLARYEDRASLVDAFTGADILVFIGSDGEADRVLAHHRTIVAAAELAAVRRVVLLSSQDADPDSPFCYAHTYAVTEDWVGSFSEAAVIRAGLYGEFFGRWVVDAANSGELRLPMSGARVAPVAQADVAACLAAAALSDGVPSDPVVFTGLKQYSLADLADEASRLTDRPVPSIDCTPPEFAHSLIAAGTSPWWTYAFCTLFEAIRQGRFDAPPSGAPGLFDGLGRPTRPFSSSLHALWRSQTTEYPLIDGQLS